MRRWGYQRLSPHASTTPVFIMGCARSGSSVTMELVQSLGRDKSNVSHSLQTLEARGLITIGRSSGGQATHLDLT
ncbi:hypothetical protein C2W62_54200, partial [Candidatus Entotheonella serta]